MLKISGKIFFVYFSKNMKKAFIEISVLGRSESARQRIGAGNYSVFVKNYIIEIL
jgi:hypothetical protein